MNENLWKVENFWASVHCTSTVLDKIAVKRRESKRVERHVLQKDEGLLSITYSEKENIESFVNIMGMKHFRIMAETMMKDAYKYNFDDSSSVNRKNTIDENSRLNALAHISLLQHTFGVVNELYKIITRRYGIYSDVFYLTAFAHDFGKSKALKWDYQIDSSLEHHKASSEYVRRVALGAENKVTITKHDDELIKTICDVLNAHHTPEDENMFHAVKSTDENKTLHIEIINKLKEADQNQRAIELEMLS